MAALGLVGGKLWVGVGVVEVEVRMELRVGVGVCRGGIHWAI